MIRCNVELAVAEDHVGDVDAAHLLLQQPVHIDVEFGVLPPAAMLFDLQRRQHFIHQPIELVDQAIGDQLQHDAPLLETGKPYADGNRPQEGHGCGDVDFDLLAFSFNTHYLLRQACVRRQDADHLLARQDNLTHI